MTTPPLVSIVILAYNSAGFIPACLASLDRQDYAPCELLLIDNASTDGSADVARAAAPHARVLALPKNLGCAGGNNAGWQATRGSFVVFMNPDTEAAPGFITGLIEPMLRDPGIGITGAKIYYPGTRKLQHAGAVTLPNGMTRHIGNSEIDEGQYDQERDVDYVTGAGFAVRRALLEQIGGFDEDYFPAYFEENDLCTRARKAGWRVVYSPAALLYHHESVSLVVHSRSFLRMYQRMRMRYVIKNYTLNDWVRRFLPGEAKWLLRAPEARGHRLEQVAAYVEGFLWAIGRRRNKRRQQRQPE